MKPRDASVAWGAALFASAVWAYGAVLVALAVGNISPVWAVVVLLLTPPVAGLVHRSWRVTAVTVAWFGAGATIL